MADRRLLLRRVAPGLFDPTAAFEKLKEAPSPGLRSRRGGAPDRRHGRTPARAAADPAGTARPGRRRGADPRHRRRRQEHAGRPDPAPARRPTTASCSISLKGETDPDRVLGEIGDAPVRDQPCAGRGRDGSAAPACRHSARAEASLARPLRYPLAEPSRRDADRLPVRQLRGQSDGRSGAGRTGGAAGALAAGAALSRLVFTCRYPFALPDDRHERLADLPSRPACRGRRPASCSGGSTG